MLKKVIIIIVAVVSVIVLCLAIVGYFTGIMQLVFGDIAAENSHEGALTWYTKAAEKGNTYAQVRLGGMYFDGKGVAQDHKEAFNWYTKAAEQDNTSAMRQLGLMYAEGKGVEKDYSKAIELRKTVARRLGLEFNGRFYAEGVSIFFGAGATFNEESLRWLLACAAEGCKHSQCLLGEIYVDGNHVITKDPEKAVYWYTRAADDKYYRGDRDSGHKTAQAWLAHAYYTGEVVPKNLERASYWAEKAAAQGFQSDYYLLGLIYVETKNYKRAAERFLKYEEFVWYSLTMDQHVSAQVHLADLYENGKGVMEDYVEAYKWYLLAGMNNADVTEARNSLREKMTPEQIEEALSQANAFVAEKESPTEN